MVGIAQLVESRIVIPVVVGSNPSTHPTYKKSQADARCLGFILSCPIQHFGAASFFLNKKIFREPLETLEVLFTLVRVVPVNI